MDKNFKEKTITEKTKTGLDTNNKNHIKLTDNPNLDKFKAGVADNQGISSKDIFNFVKEIKNSKISVFGQLMAEEEFSKIPKETIRISKEILEGEVGNEEMLTHLFPDVLEKAIILFDGDNLRLNSLTSLTDEQLELLSRYEGMLYLNGLTSLTDNQAESLSKQKGSLSLGGLTSLTDNQAESLSRHEPGYLQLVSLTFLTNQQAKSLSRHKGIIYATNEIKDQIAKYKKHE